MQCAELFSARAVAKIWRLAHLGRLTDVANHSAVNLLQFWAGELWINRVSYLQWELFFMRVLFSFPRLHSTSKNKKRGEHLLSSGHCVAFSSVALSHSFKFCPDSNFVNWSYLQEETHLCKFYVGAAHNKKKTWRCWTGDKCDLRDRPIDSVKMDKYPHLTVMYLLKRSYCFVLHCWGFCVPLISQPVLQRQSTQTQWRHFHTDINLPLATALLGIYCPWRVRTSTLSSSLSLSLLSLISSYQGACV